MVDLQHRDAKGMPSSIRTLLFLTLDLGQFIFDMSF